MSDAATNIHIACCDAHSPLYEELWELRDAVLRRPLGRSIWNDNHERDLINTIFVALDGEKPVGCVFMHPIDANTVQLRAMAVFPEWQGVGVGRMLVTAFEAHARIGGVRKIILHARKVALGFYGSMGYSVNSDEFTEVGIPHFMMEKDL